MCSDNMSAENRLLIAALKMSQIVSCGAKRSPGSHITIPSESLEKFLVADMIVYYIMYVCYSSTMRFIHINEYEYMNNYAQYIILHTRIRIQ